MTARRGVFCIGIAALLALPALGAEKVNEARAKTVEDRMRHDITFLASSECEGRGPLTKGIDRAADYIAAEFKKAGLKPAGKDGSYFQPFAINGAALEYMAPLVLRGPQGQVIELKAGEHFYPLGLASTGKAEAAPLVFAGYGITSAKDPDYDDYANIDAAGKIVIVLRDTPRALSPESIGGNWRRRYGSFTEKFQNAEKHRAAGILFVNDWDTAQTGDDLLAFNYMATSSTGAKLPAFHLSRAVADRLLESSLGVGLRQLEQDIDRELKPRSAPLTGWTGDFDLKVKRGAGTIPLKNVVGVLEGKGKLANETIVIGAHYDHVGYGGANSLARSKKMAIHHGADDNGSGTTTLIELARRFGAIPNREGRRLVFMAFSGEELGLLGSAHYCKEPIFPLGDTAAMVNLDMVGRLRPDAGNGKDKLIVYGTGTAKTFDALIESLNKKHDFKLQKVAGGMGPSDHASFYVKKVPVFFFFTGDHPQYHRPTDTADTINVAGMRKVADLVDELTAHLATVPEKPEYVAVKSGSGSNPGGPAGPRLGIMPDYSDDKEGVLLGGVAEGLPAAKAGLKAGDRLMKINDKDVKNLQNYMVLMAATKRGDTIEVSIVREGKTMPVKVKLE